MKIKRYLVAALTILALVIVSCANPAGSNSDALVGLDSTIVGSWTGTDDYGDAYTVAISDSGAITITDTATTQEATYQGAQAANGTGSCKEIEETPYTLTADKSQLILLGGLMTLTRTGSGSGIVGTWTGLMLFIPVTYTFNSDGTYEAEATSPFDQSVETTTGTYVSTATVVTTTTNATFTYALVGATLTLTIDDTIYTLTKA